MQKTDKIYNCIIVDDDFISVEMIDDFIKQFKNLKVTEKFTDPIKAIPYIRNNNPDLIFLDIKMPSINGIDLIKIFSKKRNVILITCSKEYAVQAFELNVIDYIVKPIVFERFDKSINKFLYRIQMNNTGLSDIKEYMTSEFIFVKENYKTKKIFISNILYLESYREYVHIVTEKGITKTKQRLHIFEERLKNFPFIRVHKSYIIAIHKITTFTQSSFEIEKKIIPIGRSFKEKINKRLKNLVNLVN